MNTKEVNEPCDPASWLRPLTDLSLLAVCVFFHVNCAGARLGKTLVDNREVAGGPESGVTVSRQGVQPGVRPGMSLQTDDSIETGSRSTAVLWFDGRHEIVLLPNTKVEIHSLWVKFGRILARIRGKFRIESDSVTAGVEGTEFLLRVGGPHAMAVTVVEGSVRLTSKETGRSILVNPFETGAISHAGVPGKQALSADERRIIEAQLGQIESTIRPTPRRDPGRRYGRNPSPGSGDPGDRPGGRDDGRRPTDPKPTDPGRNPRVNFEPPTRFGTEPLGRTVEPRSIRPVEENR